VAVCFLYFIETPNRVLDESTLGGLRGLVGGGVCYPSAAGPGGSPGVIYTGHKTKTARAVFDPSRQRWLPKPACTAGRVWVGAWHDLLPSPESLEWPRREWSPRLFGWQMEDGREWFFPRAMYNTGEPAVPMAIALGLDGEIVREPLQQFEQLCEDGKALFRAVAAWRGLLTLDPGESVMEDARLLGILLRALGLHYRVEAAEAQLLGLFSERNLFDVALRLVGLDLGEIDLRNFDQKKTVSNCMSGASGSVESSDADTSRITGSNGPESGGDSP
jgi:hypothetical protein